MVPDIIGPLSEHDCTKLFDTMQSDLTWQWDSRFETALAKIRIENIDAIGKTLENYLGASWNSDTIGTAPEMVQRILDRFGGIMPGQLLYAAGLPQDGIIFCAWWPWGNGQTVSIRLGVSQEGAALLDTLVSPDAR